MKTLIVSLLICSVGFSAISIATDTSNESPHAEAIRLVMILRKEEIRKLDKSPEWWHDTKERTWSAKRTFSPGVIDSTHFLQVSYSVDGKLVGTWQVNTRTGQVAGAGETLKQME